jgi:DNA invertase Pin-like site-specific DNA recombinase
MRAETTAFSKVTTTHLAKRAYVYIRQSSLGQVVHHRESTDIQYQLVERATQLGWPADRVEVIDEDLGKSGTSAKHRSGFQFLMSEIGLGQVGLVLSLDASRLARNNSDWYQLIELCSMVGTLIADSEQLYEPRLYHDRLILGLSGMMSEAELHSLRMRLQAGARHKAERGELQRHLPVGLDRQRDGAVMLTPDEEVRARLALIFAKFTELGSARAVRTYLAQENLSIPSRPVRGPGLHETVWNPPRASAILRILHNPAYAGAYVYGQYRIDPARRTPGRRGSGIVRLPIEQWAVCLQGIYPAYISWEQYLENVHRLRHNRHGFAQGRRGAPGRGKALLQGIIICARCARRMGLRYSGPQGDYPVYRCSLDAQDYGGQYCQEVRGPGLDVAVARLVLEVLVPERITLALDALEQLGLERDALERQWQLRLERTRYDAQRAQRQYDAVEPDHRLVARTLESQWEAKLREVEQAEQEYQKWKRESHAEMTPQERQEILAIGEDLPRVWHAATTTHADRKYLLRLMVRDVIVDRKRIHGKVWFQINWQTGASSEHEIVLQGVSYRDHVDGDRVQERIGQLYAQRQTDRQIATALHTEGYRTTYGGAFQAKNIWYLREKWGWPSVKEAGLRPDRLRWDDGAYTVQGAVEALGVTTDTVHEWLKKGLIQGRSLGPYMLWQIDLTPEQIQTLRQQAEQVRLKRTKRPVATSPQPGARPEAATTR